METRRENKKHGKNSASMTGRNKNSGRQTGCNWRNIGKIETTFFSKRKQICKNRLKILV